MYGEEKGVVSLMAGEIGFKEGYRDVRGEMAELSGAAQKALVLLVACDRIYGFFENRGGVANGPRLVKLVRDLAEELELTVGEGADVTVQEAKGYYDALALTGTLELVTELGAKNVFCTVWECINGVVGVDGVTLEETLKFVGV